MSSSVARVLTFAAVCLTGASNIAHAQLIESPLDSEEAKEEGLPFRGSSFAFYQTLTGNSFTRGNQLSYNPTYAWGFDLSLLWHFNRRFQIILDQGLNIEITNSDTTLNRREPRLTDTTATFGALLLKQTFSPKAQFILNGSVGLNAPTSLASQAATMILGTRVGLSSTLSLPKVLQGLGLNLSLGYLHRFLEQNVVAVDVGYPCNAGTTSRELCSALGGSTNARFAFTGSVSGELAITEKWGLSASYTHSWRRGANLADFSYVASDGAVQSLDDGTLRHWRNINTIDITVTYFATGWLGLGASATSIFAERGPDSAVRPPFRPMDTYYGLNVNLRLDELYLTANPPPPKDDE
ncbi:MAG TPA: hypothetical protein VFG30_13805 [Polyangiales bacterium]|nr:hypothetical protein [Polyangiales bacterium]